LSKFGPPLGADTVNQADWRQSEIRARRLEF